MERSRAYRKRERFALIKLQVRARTYEIDPERVAVTMMLNFGYPDTLYRRVGHKK